MQSIITNIKRHATVHHQRLKRLNENPFALPLGVFLGLILASGLALLISNHNTPKFTPNSSYIVIISHDHEKQSVPTRAATVGDLLKKLNIPLSNGDRVEPSLSTSIVQDNLRVNIYRAVPVTISDGTTVTTTLSSGATPRSIVAETGMPLYAEDEVTAAPVTNLIAENSLGQQVTVVRAVPVNLNIYGTPLALRTHAQTVGELLAMKNVKLGSKDSVTPAQTTPVTPNMQIFVNRKGTQIVSVSQSIPAPVQTVTDSTLSFGTTAVRQQGSAGTQVLTYQVNLQNGVEVGRTLLQTVTTVAPVTQIVARGLAVSIPADKQAVMAQAGIASSDYPYVDYIASHEGGWCPTKIQGTHDCPAYMNPSDVPSYGGYGIFQATPGSKMASAGSDWATSAVTQIRWATGYANARYGSWEGAYNHWIANHNW